MIRHVHKIQFSCDRCAATLEGGTSDESGPLALQNSAGFTPKHARLKIEEMLGTGHAMQTSLSITLCDECLAATKAFLLNAAGLHGERSR